MVIAVQEGLESIGDTLRELGHEVFSIGENRIADAILYKDADAYSYLNFNSIASPESATISGNTGYGALLINAANKSVEDIVHILEKRVYSPLL